VVNQAGSSVLQNFMRAIRTLPATACVAAGLALTSAAQPAHADTPVVLEGGSDDIRDAIEDLLPDREKPESLFDAERISEEAATRAAAYLRSEGYYQSEALPDAQDNPPEARVRITLGPQFHIGQSSVVYADPAPDTETQAEVTQAIGLAPPGAPARAQSVLSAEAAAVSSLQSGGYPDATALERRVIVDHATAEMRPDYRLTAGERVRLGVLRADPSETFRPGFLEDVRNWDPGAYYSPASLSQLRRDIAATGAVSRVSTRLEPNPTQPGVRDVVLDIEPAKRRSTEYGIGFSTTEGAGFEAEWAWRNVSRRADTLTVDLTLSELKQGVTVELERPHAAGPGRTIRYSASVANDDPGPYTRQGAAIAASIESARRLERGISYGVSLSADRFKDLNGERDAIVLGAFGEARRDTTGNPLDARDGKMLDVRVEPSVSTGDASIAFLRALGDARYYKSFGAEDRTTIATRARLGYVFPFSGSDDDIPPDRRFYAGGGGSVRGYDFNSIYPEERKVIGAVPGGQALTEITTEARYRLGDNIFNGNLGLVGFIDGGNAFDDWGDATEMKWGAGFGVRYDLGFAPLRLDFAVPLDPGPADPDFAIYVSLGQSF
ncbi:MAG: BamA/TamA family outer membrane protein, partial [Caulobacterales bacterium]